MQNTLILLFVLVIVAAIVNHFFPFNAMVWKILGGIAAVIIILYILVAVGLLPLPLWN